MDKAFIHVFGTAKVISAEDSWGEDEVLITGHQLKQYNGIGAADPVDEFVQYSEFEEWLHSGYARFVYCDGNLHTVTSYRVKEGVEFPENLLGDLVKYTTGQWSDGVGEGFEQQEIAGAYLSMWHFGQEARYLVTDLPHVPLPILSGRPPNTPARPVEDAMSDDELTAIRERRERAVNLVSGLNDGRARWITHIPARDTDPDVILADSLRDVPALLDEVGRLTAELAETRYNLDCANEELGTRLGAILELTAERDALVEALREWCDILELTRSGKTGTYENFEAALDEWVRLEGELFAFAGKRQSLGEKIAKSKQLAKEYEGSAQEYLATTTQPARPSPVQLLAEFSREVDDILAGTAGDGAE